MSLKYWVWLSSISGLKNAVRNELLEHFDSPEEIYYATQSALSGATGNRSDTELILRSKDFDTASRILDKCHEQATRILTISDGAYPSRLRNIYNPPIVLYVRGRLPALDDEAAIALVGTRKCTPYGIKMGRRLAYEITKGGGLVVSGLALGIDTAGAQGALRGGGSVVGVLGCAIDTVYPPSNRSLFEDVEAVGAIISEYPPGYPTAPGNFPARNRIMSGISVGTLVIEAPKRSGALITAQLALEQGRDVFVVPGNADSPVSAGSNELMKDAAKPVLTGWDILCEYDRLYPDKIRKISSDAARIPQEQPVQNMSNPGRIIHSANRRSARNVNGDKRETGEGFVKLREPSTKKVIDNEKDGAYIDVGKPTAEELEKRINELLESLSDTQMKIAAVMTKPSMHVDDIIEQTGMQASEILSELTMMQISGVVISEPGRRFSLSIPALKEGG